MALTQRNLLSFLCFRQKQIRQTSLLVLHLKSFLLQLSPENTYVQLVWMISIPFHTHLFDASYIQGESRSNSVMPVEKYCKNRLKWLRTNLGLKRGGFCSNVLLESMIKNTKILIEFLIIMNVALVWLYSNLALGLI